MFARAAIATLALGIGGNAAGFALTDALLLRRPAIRSPEEVVLIYTTRRRGAGAAMLGPARRATRTDPARVLTTE